MESAQSRRATRKKRKHVFAHRSRAHSGSGLIDLQMPRRFTILYIDYGYDNRRIIERDRAWLEFVPKGGAEPEQHMLQHATELSDDDPEISSALKRAGKVIDTAAFDVYSVYRTTSGW